MKQLKSNETIALERLTKGITLKHFLANHRALLRVAPPHPENKETSYNSW
ncbi:MAG: hypothetical protein ACLGJA_13620 [Gammaproteobacteria bacterium]